MASFFISRIDSLVDKLLDEKIAATNDPDEKAALGSLKGKVAIANAKLAYQRYKRIFRRGTVAGARGEGRQGAAPALGLHGHQETRPIPTCSTSRS